MTPLLQVRSQSQAGATDNTKHQLNERHMPCLVKRHMCVACTASLLNPGQHRYQVTVQQFTLNNLDSRIQLCNKFSTAVRSAGSQHSQLLEPLLEALLDEGSLCVIEAQLLTFSFKRGQGTKVSAVAIQAGSNMALF